jgi:hypothetical protein
MIYIAFLGVDSPVKPSRASCTRILLQTDNVIPRKSAKISSILCLSARNRVQ